MVNDNSDFKKWIPFLKSINEAIIAIKAVKNILQILPDKNRMLLVPLLPPIVDDIKNLTKKLENILITARNGTN